MRGCGTLVVFMLGCARPAAGPPPGDLPHTVAVLAPNNLTGDPLLVAGASFFEKYATRSERVTVPDVLASEARLQLARRGFDVVPAETVEHATGGRAPGSAAAAGELARHGALPGAALYLEVRRWDADAPTHPAFVLAGVAASLVDPSSGRVLWSTDRPVGPVPTPGEVALGPAYVTAARKVMEELLRPLGPERPPAP